VIELKKYKPIGSFKFYELYKYYKRSMGQSASACRAIIYDIETGIVCISSAAFIGRFYSFKNYRKITSESSKECFQCSNMKYNVKSA